MPRRALKRFGAKLLYGYPSYGIGGSFMHDITLSVDRASIKRCIADAAKNGKTLFPQFF